MKAQSYTIMLVSDFYVIVGQMNIAVKKSETVLICEPFSKSFVFAADQDLSFPPAFKKFRRGGNGLYRPVKDKAVYMREEFDIPIAKSGYSLSHAECVIFFRPVFV